MKQKTLKELLNEEVDNSNLGVSNVNGYDDVIVYKNGKQVEVDSHLDSIVIDYEIEHHASDDKLADSWVILIVNVE